MRTVLCSTTARRGALLLASLTTVAGLVGGVAAIPASAAVAHRVTHHHRAHAAVGDTSGVVLGPAVKFVRLPDGSTRQVR